jgi:glycerol-3-phosphate acyltransferase PlsY
VLVAIGLLLLAYLLGSVSGSLLLGRLRGVDIRAAGSGSTGGTNAFRTQGAWFALGTVVIDVGKGAATLVGGLLVLWPQVVPSALFVWVLSLLWSGYVGFSTIMAGLAVFLTALTWGVEGTRLAYAAAIAAFLVYTHRANLARLRRGVEPRFERARVLGRLLDRKA